MEKEQRVQIVQDQENPLRLAKPEIPAEKPTRREVPDVTLPVPVRQPTTPGTPVRTPIEVPVPVRR